jgi:SSS family solute:Na+ symporter
MSFIDSLIVAVPLIVVLAVTLYARRYLKSVADFMAGGRLGGRYLLSTARSEMGAGAIAYVSMFAWFSHGGFSLVWWKQLAAPVGLILSISGFVIYRYRQTRALTLGQFFEMRYNRKFRLVTGGLSFIAGLLNFGVIPVIGGKFMVYFLDFPLQVHFFSLSIPTYLILMGIFLTLTTLITITGGQITIMMADCIQGMFSQIFYVIIGIALILTLNWPQTRDMLLSQPPGHSLVNPFDSFSIKDFNVWYILMGIWGSVYTIMAWQNNSGFNSAAASAHESRMGYILGSWRGFALVTAMLILAVASMTYLHQPAGAALVQERLSKITDPQTAEQMRLPIGLHGRLRRGRPGSSFLGHHLHSGRGAAASQEPLFHSCSYYLAAPFDHWRRLVRLRVWSAVHADRISAHVVHRHHGYLCRRCRGLHHRRSLLEPRYHRRCLDRTACRFDPFDRRDLDSPALQRWFFRCPGCTGRLQFHSVRAFYFRKRGRGVPAQRH